MFSCIVKQAASVVLSRPRCTAHRIFSTKLSGTRTGAIGTTGGVFHCSCSKDPHALSLKYPHVSYARRTARLNSPARLIFDSRHVAFCQPLGKTAADAACILLTSAHTGVLFLPRENGCQIARQKIFARLIRPIPSHLPSIYVLVNAISQQALFRGASLTSALVGDICVPPPGNR